MGKSKLKRMAHVYTKVILKVKNKEIFKQCQELYTLNESELKHLNRNNQFALFCTFVKSQPKREVLLSFQMDNVCLVNVETIPTDTDTAIVNYFKEKWYIPLLTPEERAALRAESRRPLAKTIRLAQTQARLA